MFFDKLEMEPADPILGLTEAFAKDLRTKKVNLGVGVYRTSSLKPFVLKTVRKAEQIIFDSGFNKEYLPIEGNRQFIRLIYELIFPNDEESYTTCFGCQTPGGTGALRVLSQLIYQDIGQQICISDPTWTNHALAFQKTGLKVDAYPYYDEQNNQLAFDRMCEALEKHPEKTAVLLHVGCHNPTGVDPSIEQWKKISKILKRRHLLPFFDFAYQGFGDGLQEDAEVLRLFRAEGHEFVLAYSCSKNFGLYGERVGAAFVFCNDVIAAEKVGSHLRRIVRSLYSNPPLTGARIVETILSSQSLREEWRKEVDVMRMRIQDMRRSLVNGLISKSLNKDFSFLQSQKGMFSYCGLSKDQVENLRREFGIYMPSSGRINVAGLSEDNLEYVIDAIVSVV